jgi:hypothetical protein
MRAVVEGEHSDNAHSLLVRECADLVGRSSSISVSCSLCNISLRWISCPICRPKVLMIWGLLGEFDDLVVILFLCIAYLAMIRSTLECGCLIWDPYTNKNIDKLESIQKRTARFIKHDHKSRERGCVTNMHIDKLESIQKRGLVPAIAPEDYLKEIRNTRKTKAKQYDGFETSNIIDRQTVNSLRFLCRWTGFSVKLDFFQIFGKYTN